MDPFGLSLLVLVAAPLALAAILPAIAGRADVRPWLLPLLLALLELAGFLALWLLAGPVSFSLPWIPPLGIELAFRLDGLAFLFAILVAGIGAMVIAFSARYVPHDFHEHESGRRLSTYYALLLFFMGSMLGLVCAGDLIALYVFWEATSVSSFLLIGIHLHEKQARDNAIQAFVITAGAGLLLFVAFLAIAYEAGTTSLAALPSRAAWVASSPLAPLIALGLLVGSTAKSAQVPFQLWLPSAMVAPTPVSAYLHSATMVAAGVFLLDRLAPLVAQLPNLSGLLVAVGATTMLAGGVVAIRRTKLKQILAWSTISQYGYVTVLLGLKAWGAAAFLIGNHAVLKAGLFLSAGLVSYATGKDDVRELGGLWRRMPASTVVTGILALGLAGLPATSGFWMKELFYKEVTQSNLPWLSVASVTAGILTLVYMLRYFWRTFVSGPEPEALEPGHESLLVPAAILAGLVLLVGLFPSVGSTLTDLGASAAIASKVETKVELHLPPDLPLWLSLVTFALGGALYAWLQIRDRQLPHVHEGPFPHPVRAAAPPAELGAKLLGGLGPERFYGWLLPFTESMGGYVATVQNGRLIRYLLPLALVPVILGLVLLPQVESWPELGMPSAVQEAALALLALAFSAIGLALGSAVVRSHVAAILLVGGVGFVLALIFSLLRAPDVALVQVAVETMGALLLLVVLGRIPITVREEALATTERRSRGLRAATVIVSSALGCVVAATILALSQARGDPALGRSFFAATEALGARAVVAVILTDFRGLDTLGEISVFAAAVLGAVLVLRHGGRARHG